MAHARSVENLGDLPASRDAPEAVRCAVVGLGRIGSTLEEDRLREKPCTHAGAIAANEQCRLIAGCDRDGAARDAFRERYGVPVFAEVREMLRAHPPDLLCIATYPESHRQMVREAARAAVPVAVCEKPLAHTLRAGRAIARRHARGRITVVVNHERRYSQDYMDARRIVEEARYGRLLSVRGTLYFGRSARHDRVLLHDGTHLIDIIAYLTGDAVRPRGSFGRLRSARSSAFLWGRAGSVPVVVDVGAERDHLVFEVDLSFERGRVTVGNGVYRVEESAESGFYEGYRSLADTGARRQERTGYFSNMIADAVRCVRDPQAEPLSSARDGLAALRFIRTVRRPLRRLFW